MNKEAIDFLHTRARTLMQSLGSNMHNAHGHSYGDWAGYKGEPLEWSIHGTNNIKFWRKGKKDVTLIEFTDISPAKITKEILHKPRTIGGEIQDAQSTTIYNDTSTEQTRIYSVEIGEEFNMADDIGVTVTLGFQQQVSAGGELAFSKFVATFSQEVSSSYSKHLEQSMHKTVKTETEVVIPSKKKVTVTTERKVGRLEQDLEYWCDLEHGVRIWSHHDWNGVWDSVAEVKQMLRGLGETEGSSLHKDKYHTAAHYKRLGGISDYWMNQSFFPGHGLHFKTTSKFEKATTGSVRLLEEDLK